MDEHRCLTEGCILSTGRKHRSISKIHNRGVNDYFTRCPAHRFEGFLVEGERVVMEYQCFLPIDHDGPHLLFDLVLADGGEPRRRLGFQQQGVLPVTVTHDGRNKPAFQHLINRRRKEQAP